MKEITITMLVPNNSNIIDNIRKTIQMKKRSHKEIEYAIQVRNVENEKILVSKQFEKKWLTRFREK